MKIAQKLIALTASRDSVALPLAGHLLLLLALLLALLITLPVTAQEAVEKKVLPSESAASGAAGGGIATGEKEHHYVLHQSVELGGHIVTTEGSPATWATLVNLRSGPRLLAGSLMAHSIDRKKTPFFDELNLNATGFGGDPYAISTLRVFKGRAYDLQANFRRNRQYFNYNLFANSLIPANAVPYVPILDSPHLFNTVRKSGDMNLTLLPLSKVSIRVGYWRTVNEGPSFSSNVSKSNTNPLLDQWWRYSNDIYNGGLDWKPVKGTILSYDQFFTSYKQDTTWNIDPSNLQFQLQDGTPVSQGLNIFTTADNTCLVPGTDNTVIAKCNGTLDYHRYAPVRTLLPSEQLRFASASVPHLNMNGRFLYSGGQGSIDHYNEYYSGWSDKSINTTGRNIVRYTGVGANSHLATLPRVDVAGDFGITAQLSRKWEASNIFDFRSFRQNGHTTPHQETQFGTSLADTSNFWTPGLCPPPYTADTCPLHTPKTAADITTTFRHRYFSQTVRTDSSVIAYSPIQKLTVSWGYRWRERYIINSLQNTTTSTFTPPFANRGACANQPLNSDGTCTVTPDSEPDTDTNEIHEHWGLGGVSVRASQQLNIKLNVEAMSADEAYTRISPRHLQHYILRTFYNPQPWMHFSGAINWLEQRDNVEYVHHLAHTRDFSLGAMIEPSDKWSLDVNYAYDNDYSRTDICYYASSPLPGAGACAIPGYVDNMQPYLGNSTYHYPGHFASVNFVFTPKRKLRFAGGLQAAASNGNAEVLNDRQVMGSLQSNYQMPFGEAVVNIAEGWAWKAGWNYYGYGEGSAVGPTLPRDAHGNVITASVKHWF
ncbi:MAG TPA: hypothetical protein VGL22_05915 [Terracidiphilus sp.]